jgi:hypothetical protein
VSYLLQNGSVPAIRLFLGINGNLALNTVDSEGRTPLQYLVMSGHKEVRRRGAQQGVRAGQCPVCP